MNWGKSHSFIERHDNVDAWTNNEEGSFFSVDLKKYKVRPYAYTLKNSFDGICALKSWNFEASIDGKRWACLKRHHSDESLRGEYKSRTWTLNKMDQFYSFFRIAMTAQNHKDNWELHCSGMELYGDLMDCTESESFTKTAFATHGGTIALISDSSIINYGNITSNGAIGGFINIQCTVLKNFGRIEAKNNGRLAIQC
eukprot:103861_1